MTIEPPDSEATRREPPCPDVAELADFLMDRLDPDRDAAVCRHVDSCRRCRDRLDREKGTDWIGHVTANRDREAQAADFPHVEGYRLLEKVGSGGQGVVYKAIELKLDRLVAIKMLLDGNFAGRRQAAQLLHEARSASRLDHPHIVRVLSVRETGPNPAIVMEWIGGGTLADRMKYGPVGTGDAVSLLIDIADAVACAHARGILHRDIKPSNIMLGPDGFRDAKLTDFGLAKLRTEQGDWSTTADMVGSPHYMAIEAISSEYGPISPRSDVYSLGAVLYQTLCGRAPFGGSTPMETVYQAMNQEVIPPRVHRKNLSPDLETICLKCLRKDANDRYASAADLRDDLKRFAEGRPIMARREGRWKKARLWARRNPKLAALSGAFLILLMLTIVTQAILLKRSRTNERIAEQRLSDSIRSMELSAPLIKRFLQDLVPKPDEAAKIQDFIALRESIGTESKDLAERLKFHYVSLELAKAVRDLPGLSQKSTELTRKAREDIRRLMLENPRELAAIKVFEIPAENFVFTLQDKAEIQYAHACIQLFEMLEPGAGSKPADPDLEYLDEAIAYAGNALARNPKLDEAKGDLANYLALRANLYGQEGEYDSAERLLAKSMALAEDLLEIYFRDPNRWEYVIWKYESLAMLHLNGKRDPEGYLRILDRLDRKLEDPRRSEIPEWNRIAARITQSTFIRYLIHFDRGDLARADSILEESLDRLKGSDDAHPDLRTVKYVAQIRLERLHLQKLMGADEARLRSEHTAIERSFEKLSDSSVRLRSIATLLLFTPIEAMRNPARAAQIVATLEPATTVSDQLAERDLGEFCEIALRAGPPADTIVTDADLRDDSNRLETGAGMKAIFQAEALIRNGRTAEASRIEHRIRSIRNGDPLVPPSFDSRLNDLTKSLANSKEPTE